MIEKTIATVIIGFPNGILKNRSLCIGSCLTLFFLSSLPAFPFESYQEKPKQWLAQRWDGRNLSMGSPKAGRKKGKIQGI